MSNCCNKCMKKFCENRDKIENCKNCISEVYFQILQLNEIIAEDERKDICNLIKN